MRPEIHSATRTLLLFVAMLTAACGASESGEAGGSLDVASSGSVTGQIDGVAGEWHTLVADFEGEKRATATFGSPVGIMTSYTIQAHDGLQFAIENSVSITFTLVNGSLESAGVLYFPESGMTPNYSDHNDSVTLRVESLDGDGETATLKGQVSGMLYRVASLTAEPDKSDSIEVDLNFDVVAHKETF